MTTSDLRKTLRNMGLDGFIIPRADEHQGEYVAPCSERLAYITGFTGSAGMAAVLTERAAVFVDGRYTIQAKQQIDGKLFDICHITENPMPVWIVQNARRGAKIGYDPWLHTPDEIEKYKKSWVETGIELIPVAQNPVDAIWRDRPAAPLVQGIIHPGKFSGVDHGQKRAQIAAQLKSQNCDSYILTQPDSIAWLLNIRGGDVPYNPLALCFAAVHADGLVDLFIEPEKITTAMRQHLGNQVAIHRKADLLPWLKSLGGKRIGIDAHSAPVQIERALKECGANVQYHPDPCQLPKAVKNSAEQSGMRAAHRRDGAAIVKFLCWLNKQNPESLNEISAAEQLQKFRAELPEYRGDSFATICGFGKNGAIVHYRAEPKSKSKFRKTGMLLLDSGAQYIDGTTDITRTLFFGSPKAEHKDRYTRVLKGHIALASAQFPPGTSGSQLDSLARQFLWQASLDFDHGTGHGVGCYLCVHEGPQRISRIPNRVALQPGMVISNEPGYYKTGHYGIRIENLIMVQPVAGKNGFMRFENLTLAPYERKLIQKSMLTKTEIAWINSYHRMVYQKLRPLLNKSQTVWLAKATKPL